MYERPMFLLVVLLVFSEAGFATNTRDAVPSTCSFLQCADSYGSCNIEDSCPVGEHCSSSQCVDDIPLFSTCNPNAQENECSQGKCVDIGDGPKCQIFREIMPGNPCTSDNECYYSKSVDGSDGTLPTCEIDPTTQTRRCSGKQVNEACTTHQCIVGSYCSDATMTCTPYASLGQFCSSDSECISRFTCLDGQCSLRYSRAEGESCSNTDHCQSGLYCNGDTCSTVSSVPSSTVACDIGAPACPSKEQCTCKGYNSQNQISRCSAIKGTYVGMATIERTAYNCLDQFNCGSDTNNATTIACITSHCVKEYCTFFSRHVNELFSEYPTCLVSRIVNNNDYFNLLLTCSAYKPQDEEVDSENSASLFFVSNPLLLSIPLALFLA